MSKYTFFRAALFAVVLCGIAACSSPDEEPSRKYAVGDYFNESGVRGIVYAVDASREHGMIVSLDEAQLAWATGAWGRQACGATDDNDGMKNMIVVRNITGWSEAFPAFAWCEAKNSASVAGWVLPAYYQLRTLYAAYAVDQEKFDKALTDNAGVAFSSSVAGESDYWTSTEHNEVFAISVEFDTSSDDFPLKDEQMRVRAVRAF